MRSHGNNDAWPQLIAGCLGSLRRNANASDTKRSSIVHFGLILNLKAAREKLEALVTGTDAFALSQIQMPHTGPESVLQAIFQGVNALRANTIIHQTFTNYTNCNLWKCRRTCKLNSCKFIMASVPSKQALAS